MSSKEIFERWYYFMVIGSKELIRDINSKLVLETIMKEEPISRAAISKRLGLTKATISAIVQQLLNTSLKLEVKIRFLVESQFYFDFAVRQELLPVLISG